MSVGRISEQILFIRNGTIQCCYVNGNSSFIGTTKELANDKEFWFCCFRIMSGGVIPFWPVREKRPQEEHRKV